MTGVVTRAGKGAPLSATDHDDNLETMISLHKSDTAPDPTYPCMLWADTTATLLKLRNIADDAWITLGPLDDQKAFAGEAIDALIDSAPGTLDTLNEIAAALNDDPDFYSTITTLINGKIGNVVEDTTPQLGGTLDTNSNPINDAAGVNLQYGGNTKIATTATGADITGTLTVNGVEITGGGGGNVITELVQDTTPQLGGDLDINGKKIDGTVSPTVTATDDLGTTSYRWRDVVISRNLIGTNGSFLTSSSDPGLSLLEKSAIIHNDSGGGTGGLVLQTSGTDIRLEKSTGREVMLVATPDGSVDLYYDNNKKLETTNSGIEISGAIATDAIYETKVAMAASDIDLSSGSYFTKTISGATTLTISNVPSSGTGVSFILDLTNGGSDTVTWFSGVVWPYGSAPVLTASGRDVLGFFTHDGGTTWNGFVIGYDVQS